MLARRISAPSAIVQRRYINIDRHRFHYFVWGNHGPPIVLVHATGFHGYVWKPIAQGLSRDARVWALDQRGHGDSVKPEHGYGWEVFGDDLFHFLTVLHLTEVIAVGHSAGATAIAVCAATHPGVVQRAVLIDPILVPRLAGGQEIENPLAHRARKRRMVWDSRTSLFHSYHTREPFKTWREDVLWAYIEEGTVLRDDGHLELKCPGVVEAQIYEQAAKLDGFGFLPHVNIPVLLLRGEASTAFTQDGAAHAVSLLPRGTLETIAKTTHFLPMERPDAVERAIRKFISR
jgi:pimeloyl-ACP methyl ester carboxylesterase